MSLDMGYETRTVYLIRLKKRFRADYPYQYNTEYNRRVHQLKCDDDNNKDEVNSPYINNVNIRDFTSQKFGKNSGLYLANLYSIK